MAAMLLPLALQALDLPSNQMILGHYTTDDLNTNGWGKAFLKDLVLPIATDLTADELAMFQGSKIVAFRVGLAEEAPVTRVFVMPLDANGKPTNEVIEWPCNVSSQGWNMIELETPYTVNVPEGYGLRIGFDYEQPTKTSKPLSVVKVGTTYPTYHYVNGEWKKLILSTKGNLSMQCVVESDHFPEYVVRVRNINLPGFVPTGTDINYTFETCNLGLTTVPAGACTYEIAVDGEVIETLTNPAALGYDYVPMSGVIHTADLTAGGHTLSITPVSVNGEALDNPTVFTATFANYDYGFGRQMRLVEQFTSTECTWCPLGSQGLQALSDMRGDIAWVGIHQILSSYDPFQNAQADTIAG